MTSLRGKFNLIPRHIRKQDIEPPLDTCAFSTCDKCRDHLASQLKAVRGDNPRKQLQSCAVCGNNVIYTRYVGPCEFPKGSIEKVAIMSARLSAGYPLFDPKDSQDVVRLSDYGSRRADWEDDE